MPPSTHHRQQHWAMRERLPMWTVYRPTTRDFPGQWVARMHLCLPDPEPTDLVIMAVTLEALREQLPEGLINIGRQANDEPVIAEVWL